MGLWVLSPVWLILVFSFLNSTAAREQVVDAHSADGELYLQRLRVVEALRLARRLRPPRRPRLQLLALLQPPRGLGEAMHQLPRALAVRGDRRRRRPLLLDRRVALLLRGGSALLLQLRFLLYGPAGGEWMYNYNYNYNFNNNLSSLFKYFT